MRLNAFSLLALPVQLAIRGATATLRVASSLAEQVLRQVAPDSGDDVFERPAGARSEPEPPASKDESPPPDAPVGSTPTPPARKASPPAPPPRSEPPAVVSEEPVLVADSADPGAEDGAGPEIQIAEPWPDYRRMTADAVVDRLSEGSAAEVAMVKLYEGSHRGRKSVLEAAEMRLKALNDPPSADR